MGKKKVTDPALPVARFGGDEEFHKGAGMALFAAIADLLGTASPVVAGWCELVIDDVPKTALVLTQQWPFLPFGTDPAQVKRQQKYVAIVAVERTGLRAIEIAAPPRDKAPRASQVGGA